MNELFADPGTLDFGRERREIAAFFAEAEGFLATSERPRPSDLVGLIGVFLIERSPVVPPRHAKRAYAASPRRRQAERAQAGSAEAVRVEPEDASARILLARYEAFGTAAPQAGLFGLAIP